MSNSRPLRRRQTIRIPENDPAMLSERAANLPASRDPKWDDYRLKARTTGKRQFMGRTAHLVVKAHQRQEAADLLEGKGKLRTATDLRDRAERERRRAFRLLPGMFRSKGNR